MSQRVHEEIRDCEAVKPFRTFYFSYSARSQWILLVERKLDEISKTAQLVRLLRFKSYGDFWS